MNVGSCRPPESDLYQISPASTHSTGQWIQTTDLGTRIRRSRVPAQLVHRQEISIVKAAKVRTREWHAEPSHLAE